MAPRRAALVTGATRTRGIAAAVAEALARDGWSVATTGWRRYDATEPWGSRAEEAEALVSVLRGLGVAAGFHEDDLGDPAAPARILDAAEASVGPLIALVNVHTHSGLGGLLDTTPESFDRHLAVNARGTLLLAAEFVRRFRAEPGVGRIVNFTSGLPLAGEIAYAASKGAVEWITVSAAAECAARGITVNAVDPGPTDTGWMSAELEARIRAESLPGRVGQPGDVGGLVAFLCSPAAAWITGQVLHCDGGWSTLRTLRHGREPHRGGDRPA
jgi:3-oxoacyl-[acyl-carrier protein] reductase